MKEEPGEHRGFQQLDIRFSAARSHLNALLCARNGHASFARLFASRYPSSKFPARLVPPSISITIIIPFGAGVSPAYFRQAGRLLHKYRGALVPQKLHQTGKVAAIAVNDDFGVGYGLL
jgi:hypothetical protein